MRGAIALLIVLAASGCGGGEPAAVARGDCLGAWHAEDNPHRSSIPETMGTGSVSRWRVSHGGATGCSYLFHDWGRYVSFEGRWADDGLEWKAKPLRGEWTASQQRSALDGIVVTRDGRLLVLAKASRSWGRWCKPVGRDALRRFELCREPPERAGAQSRWVNPGALVVEEAGKRRVVRVEPPPRPAGTGEMPLVGHWERALLSPDGQWLLLEWSAECEVPYTFFARPDEGVPRPVLRAPGAWWDAPSSTVVGWESASAAIVEMRPSPCGREATRRAVRVPVPS